MPRTCRERPPPCDGRSTACAPHEDRTLAVADRIAPQRPRRPLFPRRRDRLKAGCPLTAIRGTEYLVPPLLAVCRRRTTRPWQHATLHTSSLAIKWRPSVLNIKPAIGRGAGTWACPAIRGAPGLCSKRTAAERWWPESGRRAPCRNPFLAKPRERLPCGQVPTHRSLVHSLPVAAAKKWPSGLNTPDLHRHAGPGFRHRPERPIRRRSKSRMVSRSRGFATSARCRSRSSPTGGAGSRRCNRDRELGVCGNRAAVRRVRRRRGDRLGGPSSR